MPGDPRIGFRRHRRSLLVVETDRGQAGLVGKGVIEEHCSAAGDHEYMPGAVLRQALCEMGGDRRHGKVGAGKTATDVISRQPITRIPLRS